jgi:hypothetical protein
VLRVDAGSDEWLAAARVRASAAPDSIRALLAGRSRVEVEQVEARRAILWASQLPGWDEHGRPPLFVHSPGETIFDD